MSEESFKNILKRYESTLLRIEKRLYVVEAIEESYKHKLDGNTFEIKNDIIYQMYQDTYDMLINDLSSFIKALFNEGGFFNQLNNCLSKFRVPGKTKITPPNAIYSFLNFTPTEEEIKEMKKQDSLNFKKKYQEEVQTTIINLFPRLASVKDHTSPDFKVTPDDVGELKKRFDVDDSIFEYRNNVSAHRFEEQSQTRNISGPSIIKLRDLTNKLEELFNSIRLIITDTTLGYQNLNFASLETTAEDITDLILLGNINTICQKIGMTDKIGDWRKARKCPKLS